MKMKFIETSKSVATSRVLGAQEKCGRCGKTVYMAERVSATGKVHYIQRDYSTVY